MTFLYPQLLWALTALSIPVIIHFFSFRKVKVIRFSAVQFLQKVDETTKNKRRLKHWLILISRLLFLTFLILAFAQPTLEGNQSTTSKTIIYIDNSYSMTSEVANGQSALNEAIEYAEGVINSSPFETQYQLVTNDNYNLTDSWVNSRMLSEKLTELDYTSEIFPVDKLVRQFNEMDHSSELYILSDFQKTHYSEIGQLLEETEWLRLIPVRLNSTSNAFVDSVFLSSPFVFQDQQNKLVINVRNTGNQELSDIQVKLVNNEKLLGTSSVTVEANSSQSIIFDLSMSSLSSKELEVQLVDFPVVFDNTFYLVLNDYQQPVITLVRDKKIENRFISSVYANDELFDFASMDLENPDYVRIERSDLVILEGVSNLPTWTREINRSYDLLIVPSDNYSSSELAIRSYEGQLQQLEISDRNSPYFDNIFQNRQTDQLDLPKAKILFYPQNRSQTLLSNPFGVPYLSFLERNNKTYFMGSPLSGEYTNFATHSLFVPLLYKIAQLSNQVESPLYYSLDATSLDFTSQNVRLEQNLILSGQGREFVPNTMIRQDEISMELPPENMAGGIYYLVQNADTLSTIALNISDKESDLRQYEADQLKRMISAGTSSKVMDVSSTITLEGAINENYEGAGLWKYALALALFFILVEILLIRFLK